MSVTFTENGIVGGVVTDSSLPPPPTFTVHDAEGNSHTMVGERYDYSTWFCENGEVHGPSDFYSPDPDGQRYWLLTSGYRATDVDGIRVLGVAYHRGPGGRPWCPSCFNNSDLTTCPRCGDTWRTSEMVMVEEPLTPVSASLPRDATPVNGEQQSSRPRNDYTGQLLCRGCVTYAIRSRPGHNREWNRGPFIGDAHRGEYIRTTRTIGVEYEMTGSGSVEGILQPVGIGSDPTADIEVRTPPAKGKAADIFTIHTLTKLVENGWRDGHRAGLHVHVHAPEFAVNDEGTPEYGERRWSSAQGCNSRSCTYADHYTRDIATINRTPEAKKKNRNRARFIALWVASEQVAYKFDPDRRDSEWSRPLTGNRSTRLHEVSRALSAARKGEFINPPNYDRYRSANFQALSLYQTIEFRGHGATTDSAHAAAWVAFVQGMVDLSFRISVKEIVAINQASTLRTRSELVLAALRKYHCVTKKAAAKIGEVILNGHDGSDN